MLGEDERTDFEARMKLWSWRFIVIVAMTLFGIVWNNLNAKVESYGELLEVQQGYINRIEREYDKKMGIQERSVQNVENRLERIERKLDRALDE